MFKASLIICFLLAVTSYSKLTPTDNFNITDFVGNWNVAGLFSTVDLGLAFYSCATFDVTLGTLSRLTMSLSYINTEQYQVVSNSSTVVPSPLNKADLISTTAPTPQNNYVVVYYNTTAGQAILVNDAVNLGFILSRSENPLANNFQATVTSVLNANGVPLSNVTYIFNKACDIGSLKGLTTFDASSLAGEFYGNAIFSTVPVLQGVQCFTTKFQPISNHLINVTTNLTFTNGKIIYTASSYIPLPQQPSIIANTQIKNLSPFVIIYADAGSETYVAVTGDGTKGFVFSSNPTISQTVLAQVQQALTTNGLVVSGSNFYTLSSVCQISGDDIDWSVIMV